MAEYIKETVVSQNSVPVVVSTEPSAYERVEYLIYFFLGVLEVLLVFRFVLRLLGASTTSAFVRFIYSLSAIFIFPFEGIFRRAAGPGIETTSLFEPATLVAMIVYALVVWGGVKLLRAFTDQPLES